MQKSNVAHNFFYQTGERFDRRSMTVSYNDDTYYSYWTAIARKIKGKQGQDVLLLSDNNFSSTTSKHIGELRRACPHYNIIYVPQEYGSHYLEVETMVNRITRFIEDASKLKMTQKANREEFSNYYNMLIQLNEMVCDIGPEIIEKYTPLYNAINDPEKLKEYKAKQKQRDKEKQQKLKEELNILLNKYSYIDLIEFTYADKWFNDTSVEEYNKQKELKQKLKQYFNPKNELSFIWFDNDLVRTSQHITVNRKEVEVLLKLWKKGQLKHGMTISLYTVLEVKTDYVKVGCHKIPTANLDALYNQITAKAVA